MSVKLKIKITKEILRRSKDCIFTTRNCAFSLAMRDIFPDAWVAAKVVFPFVGDLMPPQRLFLPEFALTKEMSQFIRKFDSSTPSQREEFDEQEFEVEIPDNIVEMINIEEVKELLKDHPLLEISD